MKLHLKNKILSLHHEIQIFNEDESLAYKVDSKMISISDKTEIKNAEGKVIANIHRKPISIHEIYYVEMADGTTFELRTELLHVINEVIQIESLGYSITGNVLEHDYNIVDAGGALLAECHKEWISVHESYIIDIKDDSKEDVLVAIYCVLEHILVQREQNNMDAVSSNHTN